MGVINNFANVSNASNTYPVPTNCSSVWKNQIEILPRTFQRYIACNNDHNQSRSVFKFIPCNEYIKFFWSHKSQILTYIFVGACILLSVELKCNKHYRVHQDEPSAKEKKHERQICFTWDLMARGKVYQLTRSVRAQYLLHFALD